MTSSVHRAAKPIALHLLEQVDGLVRGQRLAGPDRSGTFDADGFGDVARDDLLAVGVLERRSEGRVRVLHDPRPAAVGPHPVDEQPDIAHGEAREPYRARTVG
jgi:hypothetical protein